MNKKILAAVFTDNMVLQRNKVIKFWGTATPNSIVTISFNGYNGAASADDNGKWELNAPKMAAADNLTLLVNDGTDYVTFKNIAIGEVWLAGGQSNMEFDLLRCTDWERIKANPNPAVRFFYTPKLPYRSDGYYESFDKITWETVDSPDFNAWSAIGYIFAEELSKELGVTVGIIGCNWGGTSASCWVSRDALIEDSDLRIYMDEFEKGIEGQSDEYQKKEYNDYTVYHAVWERKCAECYEEDPAISWDDVQKKIGVCKWPGPMNLYNPFRPTGLYDQMISEVCPYSLRGFIYYQGENDDHRPKIYQKLLTRLIRQWREDWKDESLAFINTQLPMHRYEADPDFKNWPLIREAQLRVFKTIKNTGIAFIPDCGQFNEIHPVNKGPVGKRLALQALYSVYHKINASAAMAPVYTSKAVTGNRLVLYFDYADKGLKIIGCPDTFEIAGSDKVFYPATVTVKGSTLELFSDKVKEPVYGRYCWSNYCLPCLYGDNELPASPFRTDYDDSDEEISFAAVQQNLET